MTVMGEREREDWAKVDRILVTEVVPIGVRDSGGGKGSHKRSCPRLRTYRWIIRRHPISRAVLERNLSRYANRDDLSKLKGARPLIRGQALPHFRPSPSFFRHRLSSLSLAIVCARARPRALSLFLASSSSLSSLLPQLFVVARNDRRTLSDLSLTPRGTTAVLSRPNPADDETLVYCTCGSPPEKTKMRRFLSLLPWSRTVLWCPRICFSPRRRGPNRSRKSYSAHETRLRNEIPLKKEKKKRKK